MRGISWVALIVSWVVDIGGSSLANGLFLAWAVAAGKANAATLADPAALSADPQLGPPLMVIGLAGSAVAGLVAGLIAKRRYVLHGALSAAAATVLGLFSLPSALPSMPFWLVVAGFVGGPVAGAAGGYIALRQSRGRAADDPYAITEPPAA